MNTFFDYLLGRWSLMVLLILTVGCMIPSAYAEDLQMTDENIVVDKARAAWLDGSVTRALTIVEQGIREQSSVLLLQKIRGDILSTSRREQEAVQAYEMVLQEDSEALPVRWAKWSVLLRSGRSDEAIDELVRIAENDANNPVVCLRLALELRKLDRLEESLEWYQKAVALAPDYPGWRLALARARFDLLDGRGARDEVQRVLKMVDPGSPEEMAAQSLLSIVYGATKERGRRYQPIFSPVGTAAERREWASIRADAWRAFEAGRFAEAEPLLRRVLELKPSDFGATRDLGATLMELGRCEEAIPVLETVLTLTASDEIYADSFFQIGLCLANMGQWAEALVHFEILYAASIEFDESTKDVPVMGGIRILDQKKLETWLAKALQHAPHVESQKPKVNAKGRVPSSDLPTPPPLSIEDFYKKVEAERLDPDDPIATRASLMGRDADFSWFRFVIPASRVMRDDLPGGSHDFIPIDPSDTFFTTQQDIYVVFGLVTSSFDEVSLTAECFLETSKIHGNQRVIARDQIVMSMNEQTGYFMLSPPEAGWSPGLHLCGLFVGENVSAYTYADDVRFRILESTPSS